MVNVTGQVLELEIWSRPGRRSANENSAPKSMVEKYLIEANVLFAQDAFPIPQDLTDLERDILNGVVKQEDIIDFVGENCGTDFKIDYFFAYSFNEYFFGKLLYWAHLKCDLSFPKNASMLLEYIYSSDCVLINPDLECCYNISVGFPKQLQPSDFVFLGNVESVVSENSEGNGLGEF